MYYLALDDNSEQLRRHMIAFNERSETYESTAGLKFLAYNGQTHEDEKQKEYLNIPNNNAKHSLGDELNSYQRRLVHQVVQNEYPGLKTKGMGHFVAIENLSADKQVSMKQLEEESDANESECQGNGSEACISCIFILKKWRSEVLDLELCKLKYVTNNHQSIQNI